MPLSQQLAVPERSSELPANSSSYPETQLLNQHCLVSNQQSPQQSQAPTSKQVSNQTLPITSPVQSPHVNNSCQRPQTPKSMPQVLTSSSLQQSNRNAQSPQPDVIEISAHMSPVPEHLNKTRPQLSVSTPNQLSASLHPSLQVINMVQNPLTLTNGMQMYPDRNVTVPVRSEKSAQHPANSQFSDPSHTGNQVVHASVKNLNTLHLLSQPSQAYGSHPTISNAGQLPQVSYQNTQSGTPRKYTVEPKPNFYLHTIIDTSGATATQSQ